MTTISHVKAHCAHKHSWYGKPDIKLEDKSSTGYQMDSIIAPVNTGNFKDLKVHQTPSNNQTIHSDTLCIMHE